MFRPHTHRVERAWEHAHIKAPMCVSSVSSGIALTRLGAALGPALGRGGGVTCAHRPRAPLAQRLLYEVSALPPFGI